MHGTQLGDDFLFRQGKRTPDDGGDTMNVAGNEGAEDDALTLGEQRHLMAEKADGIHRSMAPAMTRDAASE